MQLSYLCRLVCVALCSAGLLLIFFDWAAWLAAPRLLSLASVAHPRRTERSLFLLALFSRLSPWLLALGAFLPAYARGEDSLAPERVGYLCLAGATALGLLLLFRVVNVGRTWLNTQRCLRACKETGMTRGRLSLLLHPTERPLLAVTGVFRPRIVVSRSVLAGSLSRDALQIALRHEEAHANHRDNLKLTVLSLLPHFSFGTKKRMSLEQHWRLAAEIAADEESIAGRQEHSLLLAETLVTLARSSSSPMLSGSLALLSGAHDLRARVERLLQGCTVGYASQQVSLTRWPMRATLAVTLGVLAALCYLGMAFGHPAAEALLHIG